MTPTIRPVNDQHEIVFPGARIGLEFGHAVIRTSREDLLAFADEITRYFDEDTQAEPESESTAAMLLRVWAQDQHAPAIYREAVRMLATEHGETLAYSDGSVLFIPVDGEAQVTEP